MFAGAALVLVGHLSGSGSGAEVGARGRINVERDLVQALSVLNAAASAVGRLTLATPSPPSTGKAFRRSSTFCH
jgi:hypothetical protein